MIHLPDWIQVANEKCYDNIYHECEATEQTEHTGLGPDSAILNSQNQVSGAHRASPVTNDAQPSILIFQYCITQGVGEWR